MVMICLKMVLQKQTLEEFNVKAHNTMAAVDKRLTEFKDKMKEKKENIYFCFN